MTSNAQDTYLVGSESGLLHLCTLHYSSTSLWSYPAHVTPVRAIAWNHFIPDIFITVATEMTIKIWQLGQTYPLFVFEISNQVNRDHTLPNFDI